MTFWPLTNTDFPTDQTFHQFHDLYTELDLHRIMSGFHGAFATGVASQQGTLTLPDTWFRPPFWDLLMLQLLRPNSSNLPCLYSTFHLEYPLVLSRFCFVKLVKSLSKIFQPYILYVSANTCAGGQKKNMDIRPGSHAIDILYWFVTCPSKHRQKPPFYGYSKKPSSLYPTVRDST